MSKDEKADLPTLGYLKVSLFNGSGKELYVFEESDWLVNEGSFSPRSLTVSTKDAAQLSVSVAYRNTGHKRSELIRFKIHDARCDSVLLFSLSFVFDSSTYSLQDLNIEHWMPLKSSGLSISPTTRTARYGHPVFKITSTSDRPWQGPGMFRALVGLTYRFEDSEWVFYQREGFCASGGWQEEEVTPAYPAYVNDLDYYSRSVLPRGQYRYDIKLISPLHTERFPISFSAKRGTTAEEYYLIRLIHDFTINASD